MELSPVCLVFPTQTEKYTLNRLNAEFDLASSTSRPDFVHTTTLNGSLMGLAVIEFKDTAQAPLEQMGQAFVKLDMSENLQFLPSYALREI